MNKHILILLAIVFTGCANSNSSLNDEDNRKDKFPIVGFVEQFVSSNPNFDSNDIMREKADSIFYAEFVSESEQKNLIEGIPVKLISLQKDSKENIMAQFESWITPPYFDFPLPIKDVNFDIVGSIKESYVASLNEKSYYIIHGKLISRIYSIDKFRLLVGRNTRIYTPFFGVRKSDYYSERYEVSLGMMHYQIDSISQFINY